MKTFIKVFIVSFLLFFLSASFGGFASLKKNDVSLEKVIESKSIKTQTNSDKPSYNLVKNPKEESYLTLEDAIDNSNRVNFLILGMEDTRSDTILLASFNRDSKKVDLISIPRDTYIHIKGYNSGELRKANALFTNLGLKGVIEASSYLLNDIPIDHYATIDYEGVIEIIDLFGGVEVDVPFHMKYKDITSDPPLDINIKKGKQTLDGEEALDFMRWRKNNNGDGYVDGDLGRIKAQQQVLDSLSQKVSSNLLTVVTKGYDYIETDMKILDLISLGKDALNIDKEDITFYTLPGEPDYRTVNRKVYSYYIHDKDEVESLIEDIYNVE